MKVSLLHSHASLNYTTHEREAERGPDSHPREGSLFFTLPILPKAREVPGLLADSARWLRFETIGEKHRAR